MDFDCSTPAVVLGLFDTGLSTARLLSARGVKVHGISISPSDSGRKTNCCDVHVCDDPSRNPDDLLKTLNWIRKHSEKKPILLACSDKMVAFVNERREQLSADFDFILPDESTTRIFLNKETQLRAVAAAGFNVPKAVYFTKAAGYARSGMENLTYPVYIKPLVGPEWISHYSHIKGFTAENPESLSRILDEIAGKNLDVMVQEIIQGPASNQVEVNSFVDRNGKVRGMLTVRKKRLYPPGMGLATSVETIRDDEAEAVSASLIAKLNLRGLLNMEFMRESRTGKLQYIETNIRPWQQVGIGSLAGIEFIDMTYMELTGQTYPDAPDAKNRITWTDPVIDAYAIIRSGHFKVSGIFEWFKNLVRSDVLSVFSLSDPLPGLKKISYGVELLRIFKQAILALLRNQNGGMK